VLKFLTREAAAEETSKTVGRWFVEPSNATGTRLLCMADDPMGSTGLALLSAPARTSLS
jgi:hypothetical protein